MALVLKKLYNGYFWLFDEVADPRANDYPLMQTPFICIIIIILWFKFIFNWGPKYMENRKAYDLRKTLIVYNLIQIIVNMYIVIEGGKMFNEMSLECSEIDYTEKGRPLLNLTYLYHITKIADLLDTVFFVLRKKQNQVSFLHVYHHFGMAAMTWIAVKFLGGGHSYYVGFINAIVHVVMYAYYLLTAYDAKYRQIVWIKKFITQIQLAQFAILLCIFGKLLLNDQCKYPKIASYFFVPQNLFITSLFLDFYIRTYIWPTKKANVKTKE